MSFWNFFTQTGGGKCSLCGSPGVTKATCPLNPMAKNPDPAKHPLAKGVKQPPLAKGAKQPKQPKQVTKKFLPPVGSNFYHGIGGDVYGTKVTEHIDPKQGVISLGGIYVKQREVGPTKSWYSTKTTPNERGTYVFDHIKKYAHLHEYRYTGDKPVKTRLDPGY